MPDRLRRHYWIYRIERDHLIYKGVVILFFAIWAVLMTNALYSAFEPVLDSGVARTSGNAQVKDAMWLIVYASPLAVTTAVMAAFRRFKVGFEFRFMEVLPLVGCGLFAVIGLAWIFLFKK